MLATILIAALSGWSPPVAIVAGAALAIGAGMATETVVERAMVRTRPANRSGE